MTSGVRAHHRPYWSKTLQRWIAAGILGGNEVTRHFFSEEAALKWQRDPAGHPMLPMGREGRVVRRVGRLNDKYRRSYQTVDGLSE